MELYRYKFTGTTVLGILKDDFGGTYYTVENCAKMIPEGKYIVDVCKSPKFKTDLPLVYSNRVPASRGIRIHAGNSYKDSEGCILVGNGCNLNDNKISDSKAALAQLLKHCGNELVITELV